MSLPEVVLPERYTYVAAFLTMRCPLGCRYCVNSSGGVLDRAGCVERTGQEWVEALNRIVPRPDVPVTLTGGEPSLHGEFIYVINHLKLGLKVDILTNLHWGRAGVDRFLGEVDPSRLCRPSPYACIRASYHPERMGDGRTLLENAVRLQSAGFSVGVFGVLYPSPRHLAAVSRMQFSCRAAGIDFRVKEYVGRYRGLWYGAYPRYPDAVSRDGARACECRISELLVAPDGSVHRCHRDLYLAEHPIGHLLDARFQIEDRFRTCEHYGHCHPCDVKVKTDFKQRPGYTSVEIKGIHAATPAIRGGGA